MTKRSVRRSILSLILTFAMVFSLVPATAMAAPEDDGESTARLFATDWVECPYGSAPYVNDKAELNMDEIWACIPELNLQVVIKESEEEEEGKPVPAEALFLYPLADDGTVGEAVEGGVSPLSYWAKPEGEDAEESEEEEMFSDEFVTLHFPDTGDYLLSHKGDTDTTKGIIIHVGYRQLGAYSAQTVSAENYLQDITCKDGEASFYIIENFDPEGQDFAYGEWTFPAGEEEEATFAPYEDSDLPSVSDEYFVDGSFDDGTTVSVKKVSGTTAGSRIYKVTVSNMPMGADWNLCFQARLGDKEPVALDIRAYYPLRTTGLFIAYPAGWDENEQPLKAEEGEGEPEPEPYDMMENLPCTVIRAVYKESEDGEAKKAKAEDLRLYKMKDENVGEEMTGAISQITYWDGEEDKTTDFVELRFPDTGDYLLCHMKDTAKTQGIKIHVGYPEIGIYSKPEMTAEALKSDDEIVCTGETAEFYLIENIEEGQEVSYKDEYLGISCDQYQDDDISEKVIVTEVNTETPGHIYKVTVDVSDFEPGEERRFEFNGQCKGDYEDSHDVSCGVNIKYMQSGLVGCEYYGDEMSEDEYRYEVEYWCWEPKTKIAFGWIDGDTGEFTTTKPWSDMTAEIHDVEDKAVVGDIRCEKDNIFAFDFSDLKFGEYNIVLKQDGEEFGRMTLSLVMGYGWYFAKEDGAYKAGDRLDYFAQWRTDDKYICPILDKEKIYKSEIAPDLVYYGPEDAEFLLQTGSDEETGMPVGNEINPSSQSKPGNPGDSDTLHTFVASSIYTEANGNANGSGTFAALYTNEEGKDVVDYVQVVPLLRVHNMEEGYTGKKYYSGLFITKEEYDAGNWDAFGDMGITEPTYWAYGETMQEVLDKLKAEAAKPGSLYKYEYINISTDLSDEDYSGRPDNQILDVGDKELKGLRLYSSMECPWPTLTIKGSLDDSRILMSGKWQDGAELNIGPKLHVFCEYALGMDADKDSAHCLTFPDDLLDGSWSGSRLGDKTVAEKDGAKAKILRNQSYGETTGTSFTIQSAMSEVEEETKNIEGDFIQSGEKSSVEIEVASEGEETTAQSIADVIDFDENVVKAIVNDDEASLKTELTINDKGDTAENDEEKQAIQELIQDAENPSSKVPDTAKKIQFIDITLKVVVVKGGANTDIAQTVTETKSELQISIPLPTDLKWTPAATSKAKDVVYNVYRYHGGKVEKVNDTPLFLIEGKLTFRTDKFSTYAIEAVENEAQSIKVTTQPTKTAYTEGEVFSPEGMKVTVTYLDGTKEETTVYTVDKTAALTPADKQVIVTCMGLTTQVPITVSGKKEPTTETPTTETPTTGAPTTETPTTETPTTEATAAVGEKVTVEGSSYVVTGAAGTEKTVTFTEADKKATKVTVPASVDINGTAYQVTVIGDNAFAGNSKLTTVTMPSSITKIGKNAFKNCTKLKKVDIAKSVTEIDTNAFYNCKKLTTVKFKGTEIKKIGQGAFAKCQSLKSVTIPKSVTEIGKEAFKDCKKLSKITIKSTVLKKVGKNAFKNIAKKPVIKVPKKQKTAYKKLLKSAGYTKTVK